MRLLLFVFASFAASAANRCDNQKIVVAVKFKTWKNGGDATKLETASSPSFWFLKRDAATYDVARKRSAFYANNTADICTDISEVKTMTEADCKAGKGGCHESDSTQYKKFFSETLLEVVTWDESCAGVKNFADIDALLSHQTDVAAFCDEKSCDNLKTFPVKSAKKKIKVGDQTRYGDGGEVEVQCKKGTEKATCTAGKWSKSSFCSGDAKSVATAKPARKTTALLLALIAVCVASCP